ncbi:TetR family transcriptional regulator [Saccharothrix sp. S26]|uniref:TetR/AcrR family transcriptional regulator n=1 Tax=Saccharothrix sp. S26 TaxID=2907215 RepID=UPI001F2BDB91|nr:TetR family transcriptional regulator [Saccharothrix sp. S26]MCE7000206.1 TetR family transcriptional regulator [Saccharothrix sp. S26]
MSERAPLRERKQQRAREQIVAAAFELFAERGFAAVTVTDIAERAEVGRTTFFRYFGDKQEVVFADEEAVVEGVTGRHRELPPVTDLAGAVAQMRVVAVELCRELTADGEHFRAHERLVRDNPELRDRAARKFARLGERLRATLLERGASAEVAVLAPQIALACYAAGSALADGDPDVLAGAVDAAFGRLSELGGQVGG